MQVAACRQIQILTGIPASLVDGQGNYLAAFPAMETTGVLPEAVCWVLQDFRLQGYDTTHPLVSYQEPGVFIGVAQLEADRFLMLGPACPLPLTMAQAAEFAQGGIKEWYLTAFCARMLATPTIPPERMTTALCAAVRLAGGPILDHSVVTLCNNIAQPMPTHQWVASELFALRETDTDRVPLHHEYTLLQAVRDGDEARLTSAMTAGLPGRVGCMSHNALRQHRYLFISLCTLVSRAAMEAGMPESDAYTLSDLYCQQMDALQDASSIDALLYRMCIAFCRHVAALHNHSSVSPLVRQCMAYLSAHLHEKVSMEDLARHCGKSTRTITRLFHAETGQTIPAYLRGEKIREAKHLLAHSRYSLSGISEFLGYPNQSYFTQVFKQVTGFTPQQYRTAPHLTQEVAEKQ